MCRKEKLLGVALAAFGIGLVTAVFFESMLFCGCLGLGCIIFGIVCLQKK